MTVLDYGFYTGKLLPDGLSGAGIEAYRNIAGWDFAEIASTTSAALAGFLQRKVAEYGWSMYATSERVMRYPNAGSVNRLEIATTTSQPVYFTGDRIGHVLPLILWDVPGFSLPP
ncbi:MAG: hypothetical protein OXG15_10205, partial [Gammaproteobacteria bacterium]|nr:hypothetical protein [Gammaproteobacteria bacterium]